MSTSNEKIAVLYGAPQLHLQTATFGIAGYISTRMAYSLCLKDLQKALGFDVKSEIKLFELLSHVNRFCLVSADLLHALQTPQELFYEAEQTSIKIFPADLLQALLQTIIQAKNDGFLNVNQLKAAKMATLLLDFFTENDLIHLIDENSGFNFYKTTAKKRLQTKLSEISNQAPLEWIRTLPDGFFEMLTQLYGFNWKDAHQNPETWAKTINDLLFSRLEPVVLKQLSDHKPKRSYKQNLTQNPQQPHLKKHLEQLQQLAEKSGHHPSIFIRLLNSLLPKNSDWPIQDRHFNLENQTDLALSAFNATLAKSMRTHPKKIK